MLTIIGILIIISIVTLLMMGKLAQLSQCLVSPYWCFICRLFCCEISVFFESGINKVSKVAAMFLFAILFFSLMKDLHIFDPLIRLMVK